MRKYTTIFTVAAVALFTLTGTLLAIDADEIVKMMNHWQGVVNSLTAAANGSNKPASLACWNMCS